MRLLQPRHTWCQFRHVFRRHLTTGPATFAQIRRELLGRQIPAKKEMVTEVRSEQLWQSITGLDVARNKVVYISHAKDNHKLLPQGHHLLYMAPTYHSSLLLPDGNDQTHAPGPPFTRRLWASGSVSFTPDWKTCMLLCRSRLLHCEESIVDVRLKSVPRADETSPSAAIGAGDKIFVDIARRYTMVSEYPPREIMTVINETRTLCFMTPRTADEVKADLEQLGDKLVKAPRLQSTYSQSFRLTPTELFRFSALTFNAHRIHLDRQYCREVEGYRDLLVHGPLLLVMMFTVLAKNGLIVTDLTYRNLAPVYVNEKINVCLAKRRPGTWDVWIAGHDDSLRVKGTAIVERRAEDITKNHATIVDRAGPRAAGKMQASQTPAENASKASSDAPVNRLGKLGRYLTSWLSGKDGR